MARAPYKTDEERKRHTLNLRLNDEEQEMLETLSESYGQTKSALLLYLLRAEYRRFKELSGGN